MRGKSLYTMDDPQDRAIVIFLLASSKLAATSVTLQASPRAMTQSNQGATILTSSHLFGVAKVLFIALKLATRIINLFNDK